MPLPTRRHHGAFIPFDPGVPVTIRLAVEDDWPGIWPFFSATVAQGETYAYPLDLTPETGREWWLAPPPSATVVLEEEGLILGSAKMGPNRPGHGDHIGTASFMVAPSARGRGVGRALAEYAVQWHRERDFHGIQFNAVVATNTVAVRLWRDLGFQIIGTVPDAFRSPAHGLVGLHVMYLPLSRP
ncbi:N-acetyltransferase family protein [Nocardioides sp.]|uniref:GNAT family N-acetyltransferase n=1 Tax=Nocardioides sp. TaxID=35761 RepID=UPI003D0D0DDF